MSGGGCHGQPMPALSTEHRHGGTQRMRCPRTVAPFVTALVFEELSQEHVEREAAS